MGAGASAHAQVASEATEELHGVMKRDIAISVCLKGETSYSSLVSSKWASHKLVDVVLAPFLKTLQKERKEAGEAGKYTLAMISLVMLQTTNISLHHDGHNIHTRLVDLVAACGDGGGVPGNPIKIEISMHADEEHAKPRFFKRMMSLGPHVGPAPLRVQVVIGSTDHRMGAEISAKWQSKTMQEAVVMPLLEHYNSIASVKLRIDDVVGLAVDGVDAPTGAAALKVPVKSLSGHLDGETMHVRLEVRAGVALHTGDGDGAGPATPAATRATAGPSGSPTHSRTVLKEEAEDNPLLRILNDIKYEQV